MAFLTVDPTAVAAAACRFWSCMEGLRPEGEIRLGGDPMPPGEPGPPAGDMPAGEAGGEKRGEEAGEPDLGSDAIDMITRRRERERFTF